jgi:hypothetical protein
MVSMSWWRDTSWEKIKAEARLMLTRKEYDEWLKRADVIERSQIRP